MRISKLLPFLSLLLLIGCGKEKDDTVLRAVTSGDYPPFEFVEKGELVGFDIDLANLIGKQMGCKVEFEQMPFQALINAVSSGKADIAIATLTLTQERQKQVDFSKPYYFEKMAVVYKKDAPIEKIDGLKGKKIATQLGSTMEIWLKKNAQDVDIVSVNTNNQAIESVKSGQVDGALLDGIQAIEFSKNNKLLAFSQVGDSLDGYSIALKKKTDLTPKIDQALEALEKSGEIEKLRKKWMGALNE
jgi:polar amino acid transport system substrate-binding protein